jgi:hypothetical protein
MALNFNFDRLADAFDENWMFLALRDRFLSLREENQI